VLTFVNIIKVPAEARPNPIAIAKQKIPRRVPITFPSNCLIVVIIPIVPKFSNPIRKEHY
jgi:hypothetical protein